MKVTKLLSVGIVLFVSLYLCGCAALVVGGGATAATVADTRGPGTVISDQSLEHDVNSNLKGAVPNGSFTVASYSHEVLLAGQVPTAADKKAAMFAVKNTKNVKKVWNYLTIGTNESLADISNDTYLTSVAKTRLIGQKGVNANNIKVVTCNGVVYLLGKKSGDPVQINGAIEGIRQIDGVKNVINLIH